VEQHLSHNCILKLTQTNEFVIQYHPVITNNKKYNFVNNILHILGHKKLVIQNIGHNNNSKLFLQKVFPGLQLRFHWVAR